MLAARHDDDDDIYIYIYIHLSIYIANREKKDVRKKTITEES